MVRDQTIQITNQMEYKCGDTNSHDDSIIFYRDIGNMQVFSQSLLELLVWLSTPRLSSWFSNSVDTSRSFSYTSEYPYIIASFRTPPRCLHYRVFGLNTTSLIPSVVEQYVFSSFFFFVYLCPSFFVLISCTLAYTCRSSTSPLISCLSR